jgi:hypothetical protein
MLSNINSTPVADATPAPPTPTTKTEKKDEGLFSFPPPKVVSYSLINNGDLLNREGQTTFAQVSEKLAAGLRRGGYVTDDKYAYFWSEKDEFAVVTAMERVNFDGTPLLGNTRWDESAHLPHAHNWSEYFSYLVGGKRVYYRVFAFVVTAKRSGNSFKRNSPPDFQMAQNWKSKGEPTLGESESPATIGDVIYTDRYKCYALLYLFVNHTRLDAPKAINALAENDKGLTQGVNREAADHLRLTGINFGG